MSTIKTLQNTHTHFNARTIVFNVSQLDYVMQAIQFAQANGFPDVNDEFDLAIGATLVSMIPSTIADTNTDMTHGFCI
jgi:hypothetical protein